MTVQVPQAAAAASVVVVEANGQPRHFQAAYWRLMRSYGAVFLELHEPGTEQVMATYAPGGWLHVRGADADIPDPTARALEHARAALDSMTKVLLAVPYSGPGLYASEASPYVAALEAIAETIQITQGRIFAELGQ